MSTRSRKQSKSYHLDPGVAGGSSGRGGCLRAFLKGGGGANGGSRKGPAGSFPSDDNDSYLYSTDGASSSGSQSHSNSINRSLYNSRYGLLEKDMINGMRINDSFQTERTGRSEFSYGEKSHKSHSNIYSNRNHFQTPMEKQKHMHKHKQQSKQKVRHRVKSVMTCGMGIKSNMSSTSGGKSWGKHSSVEGDEYDYEDIISYSQKSQAGLLDQHNSLNRRHSSASSFDARSWKTAKSSTASFSTGILSSSGPNQNAYDYAYPSDVRDETGAFPSFDGSFATAAEEIYETVDDQRKEPKSNVLKGCVPIKKKKDGRMTIGDNSERAHGHVPAHMPHIPEGMQFPKFNSSSVTDDENFPQIIFADENDEKGNKPNRTFCTPPKRGNKRGTNGGHYPDIQPFSSYQKQPTGTKRSSPDKRRNPSPIKSPREFLHEEQFLDTLANTLTTNYNTLQENIHQLTEKTEFQRLMDQQNPDRGAKIPEEVDFVADQSDLVSEFDMQSTSGGRAGPTFKQPDNLLDRQSRGNDYGPRNPHRRNGRPPHPPRQHPSSMDHFDPNQSYQINDEYDLASNLNVDGGFVGDDHEGRFQNGNMGDDTFPHRRPDMADLPRRSLFDADETSQELHPQQQQQRHHDEEDEPPYGHDGSDFRNKPLALTEAFEDFGMDDRLFAKNNKQSFEFEDTNAGEDESHRRRNNAASSPGHHQPPPASSKHRNDSIDDLPSPTKVRHSSRRKTFSKAFDFEDADANADNGEDESRRRHSNAASGPSPVSQHHAPPPPPPPPPSSKHTDESIDDLPSPTKVGHSSRHQKYDSSGEWREQRRALSLQKNKELYHREPMAESSDEKDSNRDAASEISSSVSQMTRRSDKYRNIVDSIPYRAGRLDRQTSGGSTQTQQWSNTRTSRQHKLTENYEYISRLSPVHDEEGRASPLEQSSQNRMRPSQSPKGSRNRTSPHSIQDYDGWQ